MKKSSFKWGYNFPLPAVAAYKSEQPRTHPEQHPITLGSSLSFLSGDSAVVGDFSSLRVRLRRHISRDWFSGGIVHSSSSTSS